MPGELVVEDYVFRRLDLEVLPVLERWGAVTIRTPGVGDGETRTRNNDR